MQPVCHLENAEGNSTPNGKIEEPRQRKKRLLQRKGLLESTCKGFPILAPDTSAILDVETEKLSNSSEIMNPETKKLDASEKIVPETQTQHPGKLLNHVNRAQRADEHKEQEKVTKLDNITTQAKHDISEKEIKKELISVELDIDTSET